MRRFNYDFTVTISVDGVLRDQRTIWYHQQDDPFPGGHRYEVVLEGRSVLKELRDLPLNVTQHLPAKEANTLLHRVYLTFEAPEERVAWEFVLNTIDTVRSTANTVWIAGECSPFVRSSSGDG